MACPNGTTILSASRDATVRVWKQLSQSPPKYDYTISSHGQAFINSVAYLPPSKDFPDGLVLSGGNDAIIEAREPGKAPDANAERLLPGHAHNICSIDVSPDQTWFVSGSWDATARVWDVGKWETIAELVDHQGPVWCVLAYDKDTIITGMLHSLYAQ